MPWMMAGAVAAPIISSAIGSALSSKDDDAARAARMAALAQYTGINIPSIDQQSVNLQGYKTVGQLNPTLANTVQQGQTEMSGISTDPRLKNAVMDSIQKEQDIAKGGMNDTDRAALMQLHNQISGDANAHVQSILQNRQQRGLGGAGDELAASLVAGQNASQREAQQALDLNAQMNQRAAAAVAQSGALAGQADDRSFGQQSSVKQAQDIINRFNTSNSQDTINRNVGYQNQAQQYNLDNSQNVANKSVDVANQQEMHNKGLFQNQFDNSMSLAGAKAGQYASQANTDANLAAQTRGQWATAGQGVGQGLAAYGVAKMKYGTPPTPSDTGSAITPTGTERVSDADNTYLNGKYNNLQRMMA